MFTEAPSVKSFVTGIPNPGAPKVIPTAYYSKFIPTGDILDTITVKTFPPLNIYPFSLPLKVRRPLSVQAFVAWVEEKMQSFRSFRTPADRAALRPTISRSNQVYLGILPPLESAVSSYLGSQQVLRVGVQTTKSYST